MRLVVALIPVMSNETQVSVNYRSVNYAPGEARSDNQGVWQCAAAHFSPPTTQRSTGAPAPPTLKCARPARSMTCKLLIATLSVVSALKIEQAPKPVLQHKHPLLRLRGGADQTEIAKYIVYGVSTFMFLPAGRDIVSPGAEIMPDDDKMIAKMFTDTSKDGYTFMWNQWGVNWIMLSIMKILAVSSGSVDFMKVGFAHDVVTCAMMMKGWIPEFKPFALFFGLEMLALGKLAFA